MPDATVMVIEHAERFGLAQLHQLRGRIGRGDKPSSCLLLYTPPLGETAKARLSILRESEDGFRIAEEDLRLRGAGEVLGTRQSGLPLFRLADPSFHLDLLIGREGRVAARVWRAIPSSKPPRGRALRTLLYLFERDAAVRYLRSGIRVIWPARDNSTARRCRPRSPASSPPPPSWPAASASRAAHR